VGVNSALLSDNILDRSILESYMAVQAVIDFVRSAVLYTSLSVVRVREAARVFLVRKKRSDVAVVARAHNCVDVIRKDCPSISICKLPLI
jgi:hypothetical protein